MHSNGSIYFIPDSTPRVVKLNPIDKSMTHIGPDFGEHEWQSKWFRGAMADNGIIYYVPYSRNRGILKIDTNTDTATELDVNLLPEQGWDMWTSCALALDGCIYFIPLNARRIMKLDPNNSDAIASVGDDLGRDSDKYSGTVLGIDGCVYGIPKRSTRILKYDPINHVTSFVGEEADKEFFCTGSGAVGRDGCIYMITHDCKVLKIDATNNSHCFVGNSVESDHTQYNILYSQGWGDAILGIGVASIGRHLMPNVL